MSEITREYLNSLQSFKTEEEYRASPSLNYSTIKDISNGPWGLVGERKELTGDAIKIGSYVDAFFTDKEQLNERYDVSKSEIVLTPILEALYASFSEEGVYTPTEEECLKRARELNLWASVKNDSLVIAKLTTNFFEKLKRNEEKSDKIMLTQDQHYQAHCAISNIIENESASMLIYEGEGVFLIPQFKWEFEMPTPSGGTALFRVMYDWLRVDTINKRLSVIDLKTGENQSHRFGESFIKYRYDVQAILYYMGLLAIRRTYFPEWTKCTPEDFKFLYSPKKPNKEPIIIELTERFIRENGDVLFHNGNTYKGIWALIDDAEWYINNQVFDRHRLIAENDGLITIDKLLS